MATIVDVPLEEDEVKKTEAGSEAGATVKPTETVVVPVRSDWGPISFRLAAILWIVCSFMVATLDYFEGASSGKGMMALMAVSIGLFVSSVLYLTVYVLRWVNDRSKHHTTAGSTPIEVAAAQGIVFV